MKEVLKYDKCFVCGDQNPNGLKAKFFARDDGSVISEIVADYRFQGYKDIIHGGVVFSMLDEVMVKAVLARGIFALTAEMKIKFRLPVKVGDKIVFTGTVTSTSHHLYRTIGEAVNQRGEVVATANATYLEAKGDLHDLLQQSS